jgi:hypothetical protein
VWVARVGIVVYRCFRERGQLARYTCAIYRTSLDSQQPKLLLAKGSNLCKVEPKFGRQQ